MVSPVYHQVPLGCIDSRDEDSKDGGSFIDQDYLVSSLTKREAKCLHF